MLTLYSRRAAFHDSTSSESSQISSWLSSFFFPAILEDYLIDNTSLLLWQVVFAIRFVNAGWV